jgi:formate hydrogenlyase subunit 3/multisubunit Na+/H+ antiporter MnhD subunit
MNPLFAIVVLVLGAAVMMMGYAMPRFRLIVLLPVAITLVALLGTLTMGLRLPAEVTVSAWVPSSLFQTGIMLRADPSSWLFSVAVLLVALSVFLTGLSRPGGPRLGARAASLIITAAALAAISAQNLTTLVLTWAVLDLAYFLSMVLLARGEGLESHAVLSLSFNALGNLFALGAALDILNTGASSFVIGQSSLTDRSSLLILIAIVFRLGVFPFHLAMPVETDMRQGLGTLIRLAPAAVALDLLTEVLIVSPALPLRPILSVGAGLGLLIGAMEWWGMNDPRQGLSFVVLSQSCLALLAGLWGGIAAAAGVLAFALALITGGAVMFLNNGYSESGRGWVATSIGGAVTLMGLPLTVGFIGASALYRGLIEQGGWLVLIVCVIGQWLLAASYIRLAFTPGEPLPKDDPLIAVSYLFGLILPLIFAVITGVAANAMGRWVGIPIPDLLALENLASLGAVLLVALGGVGLWQFEGVIRERAGSIWNVATSAARLEWLYRIAWETYRLIGRSLRTVAAIVEGEGGVLWTLMVALMVWLLFFNR